MKMCGEHSSSVLNGRIDVPDGLKLKPWVELVNNRLISAAVSRVGHHRRRSDNDNAAMMEK